MKITSPAFVNNGEIPNKYTCDGDDINPELHIDGVPDRAESLVLIVDDPDAPMGTWVHWVLFNVATETKKIDEDSVPDGVQGTNDFDTTSYGGPCPPSGVHRYFFKLYALDTTLDLDETATKQDVEDSMKDHVLAEATLVGKYQRH
jgi:Raf kinase inhibitor-like YbhB/YbcL family protein